MAIETAAESMGFEELARGFRGQFLRRERGVLEEVAILLEDLERRNDDSPGQVRPTDEGWSWALPGEIYHD